MAYKFVCTSCNSEITSNYLKPGDEAFCFKCASRTKVPLDAEYVTFVKDLNRIGQPIGQPDVAPAVVGKFSGVRAWNPRWFEGMSCSVWISGTGNSVGHELREIWEART